MTENLRFQCKVVEGRLSVELLRPTEERGDHLADYLSEEHRCHSCMQLRLELEFQRVVEQAAALRVVVRRRSEPPRGVEDVEYPAFRADGLNASIQAHPLNDARLHARRRAVTW